MPAIGINKFVIFKRKTLTAPDGSPSLLTATVDSDTAITLNWTTGSTNHDGHRIYISTDGVTFSENSTVLGATATKQVTGLTAGTLYYFYVVAYKGSTESTATNIYDTYFKITVDTTKAGSANDTFILPTDGASAYDYYVDWDDGAGEQHITANTSQTKDYGTPGTHQIKIRGTFPRILFNNAGDKLKLMTIDNWGNIAWSSMLKAFYGCANLTGNYNDIPNTANVTNMSTMFCNCALFNSSVAFNTSAVMFMDNMFNGCTVFNQSVANFNTANVTNMSAMFMGCRAFNQSVANFNTINVTDMSNMFNNCRVFNQSVANFNTAKVTNMYATFIDCWVFNQSVANFNTAKVTTMASMFSNCNLFNQSVANFNTANVTTFQNMFAGCLAFNQDISGFNIEKVTTMANMFSGANSLSRINYEALLVAWEAQIENLNVPFHAGDAVYEAGSAADTARAALVSSGWIITDGGNSFDNGKVVITFDDGNASIFNTGFPIFTAKSAKATLYIISDFVGTAGYVTWANLQEMATAGMDIQCHGKTHTDFTALTEAQILTELNAVNNAFTTNSLASPSHHAYPFGSYNANIQTWVATLRSTARSIIGGYVRPDSDKSVLKSYWCDDAQRTINQMKDLVDTAKIEKQGLIIFSHNVNYSGGITSSNLSDLIDYIISEGVDILTVSELYALMA